MISKATQLPSAAISTEYAVILCGGRGSRLGSITDSLPKPLIDVQGMPLLWYTFLTLYKHGFRHFIFPLGYKGEMIRQFVESQFASYECGIRFFDTGEDSPVSRRLNTIKWVLPEHGNIFLVNGDTLFDFDIKEMYNLHRRNNALITLSSVPVLSSFGLIITDKEHIIDFQRETIIESISPRGNHCTGYVNAGLTWISREALSLIDMTDNGDFEEALFQKAIHMRRLSHFRIKGNWFPIDTQKDLSIANASTNSKSDISTIVTEAKKNLANRYSYRNRYFSDPAALRDSILAKSVIPYQVEVQPPPKGNGRLCWLKCPYCYGGSAKDSGERLSHERFLDIMRQIADGGVRKIIYAGYCTDPLNSPILEDLVDISLDAKQVIGFHTKAIRLSDRLFRQLTFKDLASTSYFSVSVDAGTNATYNLVHGIANSKAHVYDQVKHNVMRLTHARQQTNAPLDISATFLLNNVNSSESEVLKFITDFRSAGADLLRFTFPQTPRGYTKINNDPFIPDRPEIERHLERLRPIIDKEHSPECQILLMDLDAAHSEPPPPRTLPCFARFVFPCIGFDGWLSHCSESCAPHFREMAIGNLAERNFWDLFYDYDPDRINDMLTTNRSKMDMYSCKCDRKEHVVNSCLIKAGVFNGK